jgi:hypothetical protein
MGRETGEGGVLAFYLYFVFSWKYFVFCIHRNDYDTRRQDEHR